MASTPESEAAAVTPTPVDVLRRYIMDAVSRASGRLKEIAPNWWDLAVQWERGLDGHFREHKKHMRTLWQVLTDEWLRSVPNYDACIQYLQSNLLVSSHLERLVGTAMSASTMTANQILTSLIHATVDDDGQIVFTDTRFDAKWREFLDFFKETQIPYNVVSPLPHLKMPSFPLKLNDKIVLDRLTNDEVTRCLQAGVLREPAPHFPLIYNDIAVGIRSTTSLPKLIGEVGEKHKVPSGEGSFGNRPTGRADLLIDDVLCALRLFKHSKIHTAGYIAWSDAFHLKSGTLAQVLGQWPYFGTYELSQQEIPQFIELWRLLEDGASRFPFSIHRFNLAFDRGLLADRIVDLVIAAEALFLADIGKDRTELSFRSALRAAKFIQHPTRSEREVFRIIKLAYDERSAIVHGGSHNRTDPPKSFHTLPDFIDAVEELMRFGLRKALSMVHDGKKLDSDYWLGLVLSTHASST